jgi:hypothetical protein
MAQPLSDEALLSKDDLFLNIGTAGLRQSGGFVTEDFLTTLQGQRGVRYYKEMSRNNSIIGAILFIIDSLIRQVDWRVETPMGMEDNPKAIAEKAFIESCLLDMSHSWEDFVSESNSDLVYGWSWFETVYKIRKGDTGDPTTESQYSDGRWGWREFEVRSQDTLCRWIFDERNNLLGLEQDDPYVTQLSGSGNVIIPLEKSLLFRTSVRKGNPEGISLLRSAVRDYHYLKNIQEFEAIGIERDMAGLPVMQVPPEILSTNASAAQKNIRAQLETLIQTVKMNQQMGALIPSELDREGNPTGYKFSLMSSAGKRMIDTDTTIKRYESRMAMTFLADFIMIGSTKVGTQSLFQGKTNMFALALGNILKQKAAVFNKFAIGRLMDLNGVSREFWPVMVPGELETPDLANLGSFVQNLASAGLLSPNKQLENKLLSFANLPIVEQEEDDIFADPTMPTPRDASDQAAGLMSPDQISMVADVNRQVATNALDIDVARNLLASGLGMSIEAVNRFVKEPAPRTEEPALLPQVKPDANTPSPDELAEEDAVETAEKLAE